MTGLMHPKYVVREGSGCCYFGTVDEARVFQDKCGGELFELILSERPIRISPPKEHKDA